ncbi:MAG: hypothetical protein OEU51_01855 [Gammaproteobacteria bacterium]|nr:hypothetical protein [Gammaproteobacteria bacterium]
MNSVAKESGNTGTQSKSGKSRQPKQAAAARGKPEKQAAKNKKPISAGSQSTGTKPAGKKKTAMKKATGRKKTATKRKSATRHTGASGEKPAADTSSTQLASVPIEPPPVTFPDAAAAADDPRSLSWMAQQAVSALNAVKANQAEKGKTVMARAENDKPEREHAASGKQTRKAVQATGPGTGERASRESVPAAVGGNVTEPVSIPVDAGQGEPGAAGQLQVQGIEISATGSSGKDNRADTGTQQVAEKQPAPSGVANRPASKPARIPESGGRVVAGSPPRRAAKRRYPTRLQAVMAVVIAVPLWLYFGSADKAVHVTTQAEQDSASKPVIEPAGQSVSVSADKPVWQPTTATTHTPEPVPESQQPAGPAVPVVSGEPDDVPALEIAPPVAGAVVTPVNEPDHGTADSAPAQRARPPGYRTPGYGYYPPQPSWQPRYYRPGYSRPPSR